MNQKRISGLVEEAVKWALRTVIKANHIPKAAGGPMTRVYTEYAKVVVELYFSQSRQEPFWKAFRDVSPRLVKHAEFITHLTNSLSKYSHQIHSSPVALFGSLIDPRVATEIKREQDTLLISAKQIIELLDGINATTEDLLVIVWKSIKELEDYQSKEREQSFLERNLGYSLHTLKIDWCYRVNELMRATEVLIQERNRWALIAHTSTIRVKSHHEIRSRCDYVN